MYHNSISNMMSRLKFTQEKCYTLGNKLIESVCPDGTRTKQSRGTMHILLSNLFVWIFVLSVTASVIVADVESTPLDVDSETLSSSDESVSEQEQVLPTGELEFIGFEKDKSIREGLHVLAARFKKNIVPSSKVDGPLNVTSLYDVTFKQALEAILGNEFKYEQEGNFIKVYTAEEYKKIKEDPARMLFKVFTLYYISAAEAQKLITPVLSTNGRVEVTAAASTDFPTGASISSTTGGGDSTALNDTIIVYDYPEKIEQITDVLKRVDVRPKQVLIEATILAVTLSEDSQYGIDWQTLQGTVTSVSDISRNTSDYFGFSGTAQVTKTGGLTVGFAHDNVAAVIKALEAVSDVTIMANPKILAVNKQLGQVYIGQKLGYESQTTTMPGTDYQTSSVDFRDTGTKLSFRPYIGNDGYIRMDIHPKDSSGSLKENNIPDETSAELVTNIIVKDGETVVIGGLFRDKIKSSRTQVPLVGNLPVVGVLFNGIADSVERQEVMVLLTPHIIEEPNQTNGDARTDDIRRKRFGAKDGLQLIDRARLAEDSYAQAVRHYVEGDNIAAMRNLFVALMIRPTYLEALRLKERIVAEIDPEGMEKLERIILEDLDRQEAPNWMRR
jgi:type IV pilus assembly protein PilQ